jgi:hypothetical protein
VPNFEVEGARLGQLDETPLDQFGEGARRRILGETAFGGSVTD